MNIKLIPKRTHSIQLNYMRKYTIEGKNKKNQIEFKVNLYLSSDKTVNIVFRIHTYRTNVVLNQIRLNILIIFNSYHAYILNQMRRSE